MVAASAVPMVIPQRMEWRDKPAVNAGREKEQAAVCRLSVVSFFQGKNQHLWTQGQGVLQVVPALFSNCKHSKQEVWGAREIV